MILAEQKVLLASTMVHHENLIFFSKNPFENNQIW